ncbi:hypothetical protein [Niallia circulans]|uniref:hypothetical protein n=1 Tax=Niallia circulans TaxID=1397 RepID=UPI00113FC994|nr:hypothetical protein [Niallia circulans]
MFMYFLMLSLGIIFLLISVIYIVQMYKDRNYSLIIMGKTLVVLSVGIFLLLITFPSLKYILLKEYIEVIGECTIEIDGTRRYAEARFEMQDTGEVYSFDNIPDLDAFGKNVPYYCTLTVTKDKKWEIGYKIYNVNTKKLIISDE